MNEEVGRINELKGLILSNKTKVENINDDELKDLQYQMNVNMTKLYHLNGDKLRINEFIDSFVENIYIILDIISEMHLTPEYFFNIVLKANNAFMEFSKKHPDLLPNEARKAFAEEYSISRVHDDIIHAIYNGNYKKEAYKGEEHNIDYYFMRIVEQYQKNKIPYGNTSTYQCQKSFLSHFIGIINTMNHFYNCDDIGDEVECMMNLLYDYLCFFVEIGVNPKIYIDEFIEKKAMKAKK